MSRKKKQPEPENHERWLVSYADFITLLFAFFVVMFASSQADQEKAKAVSDSVREALEEGGFGTLVSTVLGGGTSKADGIDALDAVDAALTDGHHHGAQPGEGGKLFELQPALEYLTAELSEQIENGQMEINLEARGLVVSFREAMLFESGKADLTGQNLGAVGKVASVLRNLPNPVRMEGHTDAIPIHNSRFSSNWELSAARSITMLEIFANRFKIPREKMSIAAYADNAPVDTNENPEGRARNRRVDIIVLSEIGLQAEPSKTADSGAANADHTVSDGH